MKIEMFLIIVKSILKDFFSTKQFFSLELKELIIVNINTSVIIK